MSTKPNRKWKSKYRGDLLKDEEHLAEIILEKVVLKSNSVLGVDYHRDKRWGRIYKDEIRFAKQLLKLYDVRAIIEALKSKQLSNIYTLNCPWLDAIVKKEQGRLDSFKLIKEETPLSISLHDIPDKRPEFVDKKSNLAALDGL